MKSMTKIYNCKKYDTKTAEFIGEHIEKDYEGNVFSFEKLYRKANGEFFYHTSFSGMDGGEGIRVAHPSEVALWAEDFLSAEQYEALFGEVPEDDNEYVMAAFLLDTHTNKLINEYANKNNISFGAAVKDMIVK